jgi:hypothetical protein
MLGQTTAVDLKCQMAFQAAVPPGSYVEATRFHYSYADKFKLLQKNPGQKTILAGNFTVDHVDNLLLVPGAESEATGTVLAHIDLNDAAGILYGKSSLQVTREATFRKQPDGNWVATSI